MCELLAMSARQPAEISFSLEEFSQHGGLSGPHKDGWGIAFYEDRDARIIREPLSAASSAWIRLIESAPIRSRLVLSHIRRATQGVVKIENTQPFSRELGGRLHVFAHNGELDAARLSKMPTGHFQPIGETDSERAFCALLARLEATWMHDGEPPTLDERREVIESFANDLRLLGIANFLYSDGELLIAHSHKRHQSDGSIRPPGLHFLCRQCAQESNTDIEAPGFRLSSEDLDQSVVLVASVPLTAEGWEPLGTGEILTIAAGQILSHTRFDG